MIEARVIRVGENNTTQGPVERLEALRVLFKDWGRSEDTTLPADSVFHELQYITVDTHHQNVCRANEQQTEPEFLSEAEVEELLGAAETELSSYVDGLLYPGGKPDNPAT